jgi:hypothetical protein
MRLPGYLIAFVLTLLLVTTTPLGTGTGLHQLDLLHPVFAHLHLVNGRLLTHEQMATQVDAPVPTHGPAVGAGSPDDGGLGVSSSLAVHAFGTLSSTRWDRLALDTLSPPGRKDLPPDPPPL